jgi:hypothetical protein
MKKKKILFGFTQRKPEREQNKNEEEEKVCSQSGV